MLDVIVVIVAFNSARTITGLLDSIPPAAPGLHVEVVVVDNGSSDDTVATARAHGGCTVVEGTNVGYSAGLNLGVASSPSADYVLLLNPDTVLIAGAVTALVEAARRTSPGIVVPQIRTPEGELDHTLRREPTILRAVGLNGTGRPTFSEAVAADAAYAEAQVVDWAVGAAMLISMDCYQALDGWDESFFLYSEETDFCLRARDAGYPTTYEPTALVVHVGGGSGRNDWTHSMQIVNKVRLYARRHGRVAGSAYWAVTVLSEVSWIVRGHPQSKASVRALLQPSRRPPELGLSNALVPR